MKNNISLLFSTIALAASLYNSAPESFSFSKDPSSKIATVKSASEGIIQRGVQEFTQSSSPRIFPICDASCSGNYTP